MAELLDYDDDPAATAAEQWVRRTKVGRSTRRLATNAPAKIVERMLLRACRAGWLLRDKEVQSETNEIKRLQAELDATGSILLDVQQEVIAYRFVAIDSFGEDAPYPKNHAEYIRMLDAAEAKEKSDG